MYTHLRDVAFLKVFGSINHVCAAILGNKIGCKLGKI